MLRELVVRHAHAGSEGELVFCWDHARYVNHSCRPNCVELGLSFELASRTIEAGEELTCDYDAVGTLLSFECRCGAPGCRGPIGRSGLEPSDADLSRADAELVELASALARAEAQPLLAYAAPEPVDRLLLRGGRRAS